jgi:protein Tex
MHQSGLVHVSRLADRFVRDPHDVVAVGDIVKVWVMGIDKERQRVSLTMIPPGSERARPPRHEGRPSHGKPAGEGAPAEGGHGARQRPPRPQGQQRPPRPGGQGRPAGQAGQQRPPRPQGERRPPRSQDRPQGRGRPPRDYERPLPRPRPAPRPMIPITDEMKTGKEPMRTFGDLLQFYQHKTVPPTDGRPTAAAEQPPAMPIEQTPVASVEQLPAIAEQLPMIVEQPSVADSLPPSHEDTKEEGQG